MKKHSGAAKRNRFAVFMGPNAPLSNGTLIPVIEKQASYMIKFVDKMQRQQIKYEDLHYNVPTRSRLPFGLRSFAVKPDVVRKLNAHHQKFLRRTVFSDSCRSWYKGGRAEGKVIGIWPGNSYLLY